MRTSAHLELVSPRDPSALDEVRRLFVEYAESLGFSLSYQGFEAELEELPGKYAPPTGALLLARVDGASAGVVALRRLTPDTCEMKRLYVRPAFRGLRSEDGRSVGRALATAILDEARALGYRRIRLDTIVGRMDAAVRLYRAMGFVEIPPYYPSPVPGTAFMELTL